MEMSRYAMALSLLGLALIIALPADCVEISTESVQNVGAGQWNVPIRLNDGGDVSSLQFDLHFPNEQLTVADVTTGGAASSTNKGASFNVVRPGVLRVIVAGMNQLSIGDGVVANVAFKAADTATEGKVFLRVRDTVAATGGGNPVASNGVDGSFELAMKEGERPGDEGVLQAVDTVERDAPVVESSDIQTQGKIVIPGVAETDVAAPIYAVNLHEVS